MGTTSQVIPQPAESLQVGQPFNPYRRGLAAPMAPGLMALRALSPTAKLVHCYLRWSASSRGSCWLPFIGIAAGVGIGERQARRAIKELQAYGLIRTVRRGSSLARMANTYEFLYHSCFDPDAQSSPFDGDFGPAGFAPDMADTSDKSGDSNDRSKLTDMSKTVTDMSRNLTDVSKSLSDVSAHMVPEGFVGCKEEEEGPLAPEQIPPPASPTASASDWIQDTLKMEARAFLAAKIPEFFARYPGSGGKPGAIEEALSAYGREPRKLSIAEWWEGIIEALEAYRNNTARSAKRHPDALFWFRDDYHLRPWGRRPGRFISASSEGKSESAMAFVDPPNLLAMPVRTAPLKPKANCKKCCGTGKLLAELTKEIIDSDMSTAEIIAWQDANSVECSSCSPSAKSDVA